MSLKQALERCDAEEMLSAIAARFSVTVADLKGWARSPRRIVEARHVAFWALLRGMSSVEAGRILRKNHTTILDGARNVELAIARDPALERELLRIAGFPRVLNKCAQPVHSQCITSVFVGKIGCFEPITEPSTNPPAQTCAPVFDLSHQPEHSPKLRKCPPMTSPLWRTWADQLAAALFMEPRATGDVLAWADRELGMTDELAKQLIAYGDEDMWFLSADGKWRAGRRAKAAE